MGWKQPAKRPFDIFELLEVRYGPEVKNIRHQDISSSITRTKSCERLAMLPLLKSSRAIFVAGEAVLLLDPSFPEPNRLLLGPSCWVLSIVESHIPELS